jgi:hypothetical protein
LWCAAFDRTAEDSGIANRLGKRLMDWRKLTDTKLEVWACG